MSIETLWPNWTDKPLLFRLYDLANGKERPSSEVKNTIVDAIKEIMDLTDEAINAAAGTEEPPREP